MFRKLAEMVLILRWPLSLILIFLTILGAYGLKRLTIDPSMETLFVKNSPDYQFYREYRDKYGSDQMVVIAMGTEDLFTMRNLRLLSNLTHEINKFSGVERVLSLANTFDIQHKFMGVKIEPVLEKVLDEEKSLEDLRREVMNNELFVGNLVSKDGKNATLLIYLKPSKKNNTAASELIKELQTRLNLLERPGIKFYLAGSPVEQYEFIRLIRRDQFTFVPLITLLLIITTLLIYRSFACMLLAMSTVFMTLIWSIGIIGLVGQQLNLMTSLLAPVIMIVSVANSIHLMNLFFEIRPHHPSLRRSVVLTMDKLGIPCFLANFTTVLGFFSLAFNSIPAIQSFGIFSALGTFFSYIIELLLTPILLPMLPYRRMTDAFDERHFFNRFLIRYLEKLEFRWKWVILLGTFLVIAVSIVGIKQIKVDSNLVKQMRPDIPLAISTRFIDENITGVYTISFLLKRRDGGSFVDYSTLAALDEFKEYLESMPAISKVNSITTVIKKIHSAKEDSRAAYHIPDDAFLLEKYFAGLSESEDPELWKIISRDFREIHMEVRVRAVGTTEGEEVEYAARAFLDKRMNHLFDYRVTGNIVLLGKMSQALVNNQIGSFGFAFISILTIIVLFFRSVGMGLLAAIPNLIPILTVYGLMGFLKIELSSTTAIISCVVLGLVVDSSIHFLHRFREEFKHRFHYLQALHHTYRNVGQALVVSTMILCAGFASSVFAYFRPTIHFGVLTSLTIFLSLLCTLIVLPVCLIILKPFGPQKLFDHRSARREWLRKIGLRDWENSLFRKPDRPRQK